MYFTKLTLSTFLLTGCYERLDPVPMLGEGSEKMSRNSEQVQGE